MQRKIAQITWISYFNFGSVLQAYALQRVLNGMGFDSSVICDMRFTVNKSLRSHLGRVKSILINIVYSSNAYIKSRRYKDFIRKYIDVDYSWKDERDLIARYDVFICGSDQIWSPLLPDHHNGFYFASFVPGHGYKKIAYAPSLGSRRYDEEYATMVRPWLKSFYALSSREEIGAEIISEITGCRDIEVVIDPTLLLPSIHWHSLLSKSCLKTSVKRKRLVGYFLSYNESYLIASKQIALEKGLELVIIGEDKRMKKFTNAYFPNFGPLEFLDAIANAEYVITDSFHGTIFSLHFKKPFIAVKRFRKEQKNNQNSRIENLFKMMGITDNFLDQYEMSEACKSGKYPSIPIWNDVYDRIEVFRRKSIDFISRNLA